MIGKFGTAGAFPDLATHIGLLGRLSSPLLAPCVKHRSRWLQASVVRMEVCANHRSRRGRSEPGWREQPWAGCHRRGEGASRTKAAPGIGRAGESRSAAWAPRGALAIRAPAAPDG